MARWYIIHAYSGFENKVRESILSEAQRMGLSAEGVRKLERRALRRLAEERELQALAA